MELARKVADIYLAGQVHDPAEARPASAASAVAVPLPTLTEYAGLYWDQEDLQVQRAVLRNGKLFVAGLELMPLTESRFRLAIDATETYTFEKSADGTHWRMTIQDTGDPPEVYDQTAPFRPSADQLADYAGSYLSEEIDPVYRIAVEDGGLVLRRLKASPQKLRPIVADYFQGLDGLAGLSILKEIKPGTRRVSCWIRMASRTFVSPGSRCERISFRLASFPCGRLQEHRQTISSRRV